VVAASDVAKVVTAQVLKSEETWYGRSEFQSVALPVPVDHLVVESVGPGA
jgi:hypothetical protein